MDAYLHILRKRQRYYSTVYGPRINIQDSQFYSWLLNDWERLMGSGADKPRRSWSMFKHQWSAEELAVLPLLPQINLSLGLQQQISLFKICET
ncbi:hypothetical protein LWI28_011140 [Acer negundo]|uniref:Uncharacterized protein n=1 Tax=Acer negundo TaxID=4023 RepID=A0AAD5IYU5_ACENE|nr:hypothetical protein LWI28_011140 [Acer negundo]